MTDEWLVMGDEWWTIGDERPLDVLTLFKVLYTYTRPGVFNPIPSTFSTTSIWAGVFMVQQLANSQWCLDDKVVFVYLTNFQFCPSQNKKKCHPGGEGEFTWERRHLAARLPSALPPVQGVEDHLHEVSFIPYQPSTQHSSGSRGSLRAFGPLDHSARRVRISLGASGFMYRGLNTDSAKVTFLTYL